MLYCLLRRLEAVLFPEKYQEGQRDLQEMGRRSYGSCDDENGLKLCAVFGRVARGHERRGGGKTERHL